MEGPGTLRIRHEGRPFPTCEGLYKPTLTRLTFTAPDGTEYELRDQLNGGKAINAHLSNACTTQDVSRGRVFVTADGTSATFISDYELIDEQNIGVATDFGDGYLMLRDGSHYRIEGGYVRWLRDRNGNKVSFGYGAGGRVTLITDSLNRQVTITYATNTPGYDQINFNGFGGAPRTMRIWHDNLSAALRAGSGLASHAQLFPELNNAIGMFNPPVTSALELPDGRRYQFYYNSYGELARVVLPTGGAIEYDWEAGVQGNYPSGVLQRTSANTRNQYQIYRRVVTRRVYANGESTPESSTTFSRPEQAGSSVGFVEVDHFNASGSLLASEKDYYFGSASNSLYQGPLSYPAWNDGKEYKTEQYNTDGTNLTNMLRRVEYTWQPGTPMSSNPTAAINGRVVETVTTLGDTNQVSRQSSLNPNNANDKGFDQYNNQTDVWEYDFGTGAPGPLLRHTHTDYLTTNSVNGLAYDTLNPNITNPDPAATIHLRGLPGASRVYAVNNGVESLAAQSTITYDEPAYPLLTYGSLAGWLDPGTAARGNVTTTGKWLDTSGAYLLTHSQYDQAGSLRSAWDANGNQSQIEYSSANAYAFPTLTKTAVPDPSGVYGSNTWLVATAVYDIDTGAVTSTTDANGQTTSFEYNDVLDRLTRVNLPDGGRTTYVYVDAHQCGPYVEKRTLLDGSGREADSYQFFDGLGRSKRAFSFENQDTNNPYLTVDTQYDALGRAWSVSSPYRSTGCTAAVNPSGHWTQTTFDALSRPAQVTTADGAVVTSAYSGNTVTVTDQAGKKRRSVTDAFGRLTRVDEPDANGNLGDVSSPVQPTSYAYDTLDNLTTVTQGSQTRTFVYDSLKRLTSATNPESGTMGYQYDNNGNLTARVDARNVTTNYSYDGLNRNTSVSYSDGTMGIGRVYDQTANGKGRLSWEWQCGAGGCGSLASFNYDSLGRVANQHQQFWINGNWGPPYSVYRAYDLAGHVGSQTYPSGRTVTYNYDSAGRLADKDAQHLAFSGNLGDGVTRIYASGITYSTLGGMQQEQFGTQTPLFHKLHYNVRGQLFDLRLSTMSLQTDEWDWNRGALLSYYSQAELSCLTNQCRANSGPGNNGNLILAQHFVPANDQISNYDYTQDQYTYDQLNRLRSVAEQHAWLGGNSAQDFTQIFDYDRWGNRTINPATTNAPKPQFTASSATNRLGMPGGQAGQMDYDAAGNLTNDTYTGAGARTYDAENRMTQAWANNQWQYYTYNASGQRARRKVGGVETWQVYGIDGELLAEYPANGAAAIPRKEYGYRNGQLLIEVTVGTGWGSPPVMHDDQLVGITVQSRHITELRAAIDALRGHLGMSAFSWQQAAGPGDWIRVDPILEMRAALDQALGAPPLGYSAGLAQGFPIRAIHIQELRDRVLAAWSSGSSLQINWLVADQLGTPRMIVDQTGSLASVKRHDYLPFGEELGLIGGRTTGMGYSSNDTVRQKFTSKERDVETGLDYFLARYYSSTQGRFTSPDEFTGGPDELFEEAAAGNPTFYADLADPQSLNKYQYTYNNPLRFVDPDGHQGTETVKQILKTVGQTIVATGNGAINTWGQDNGLPVEGGPENTVGRGIGHAAALVQSAGEIVGGVTAAVGGGGEAGLTVPACATGAGCVLPAVGVAAAVGGVVATIHGGLVGANTLNNIFNKNSAGQQSSGEPPGQTSAGRPTDQNGRPLGPSGKPTIHQNDFPTKKAAKDAARNAGQGAPMKHPSPQRGQPHFHPTKGGKKVPDGTHYNYPQ